MEPKIGMVFKLPIGKKCLIKEWGVKKNGGVGTKRFIYTNLSTSLFVEVYSPF